MIEPFTLDRIASYVSCRRNIVFAKQQNMNKFKTLDPYLINHKLSFGSFQYRIVAWQKVVQKGIFLCPFQKKYP